MKLDGLREVREWHGMSQQELSEESGVSIASIASYETGECSAPPSMAWQLADCLRVPMERLMLNPGEASRRVNSKLARSAGALTEQQYLQARIEDAFPQLFERERLPKEQVAETLEAARLILGDLGRTMSMAQADTLFEAVRPTLTAEDLRQVCVALYYAQLDKGSRLP